MKRFGVLYFFLLLLALAGWGLFVGQLVHDNVVARDARIERVEARTAGIAAFLNEMMSR